MTPRQATPTRATCPVYRDVCPEHGFVHGAEAEELRKGIEIVMCMPPGMWRLGMSELLDRTDARDSLAYLEATPIRTGEVSAECQPCDDFRNGMGDFNVHECFAPFDGSRPCGGTVRFCDNCNSDHHDGGYQTCKGMRSCRRNHPACLEALATPKAPK